MSSPVTGPEEARAVYLVDAVRTPIGRFRGALSSVRADDMAGHLLAGLSARQTVVCERLDHVVMGSTNQAGEDNRNVARMSLLLAGSVIVELITLIDGQIPLTAISQM